MMAAVALVPVAAPICRADGPPPEPDLLFYDMDFNNNGQRDNGDLAKLCEYYMDFRNRGHLTQVTNQANVYHDTVLDHRDVELLLDDWLNPRYHPFLTPGPWPPTSSSQLPTLRIALRPQRPWMWIVAGQSSGDGMATVPAFGLGDFAGTSTR